MKYAIVLAAAVGLAVFGWDAVSNNPAAAARTPASQPARAIAGPAAGPAVASAQSETVVESGTASIFLSGVGTEWTLVTAPQHGALKMIMDRTVEWTQGATVTSYRANGLEPMLANRGHAYVFYNPTPGYVGSDLFKWHSSNAAGTSGDVVCSIMVTPNSAPVADNQSIVCVQGGGNSYIALSYSDADPGVSAGFNGLPHGGQKMSFTLISAPAHGTIKYWNGGQPGSKGEDSDLQVGKPVLYYCWKYTPEATYAGPDKFTWKCNDTFVDSATATVSITVAPKGAGPTARPVVAFKEGEYTGPGDIVPNAMAWYGVRGYSRAVAATGKQKALHILRFSDGAGMDVLIKPNGDLDTAAAVKFCQGTPGRITVWYDQSGHGSDVWGGCHVESPPLLTTLSRKVQSQAGRPCPEFTPDSLPCVEIQTDDRELVNTRFAGASPAGTFSTVARPISHGFGGQIINMNGFNGRSLMTQLLCKAPGPNGAAMTVGVGKAETRVTADVDARDKAALHAFQAVFNGASSVLNVDGTPTPVKIDAVNLANGIDFGGCYGGGGWIGQMTEAGVWPTAFSADEQAAMYQNQQRYWHLPAAAGAATDKPAGK